MTITKPFLIYISFTPCSMKYFIISFLPINNFYYWKIKINSMVNYIYIFFTTFLFSAFIRNTQ
ncbi:hypothetical protein U3516DRAFT_897274 [Neocallimastix sp. 'constans']